MDIDIDHLRSWIGRTEDVSDRIDARLVRSFLATLDQDPAGVAVGQAAPLCIHWCLAPPIVPNTGTGVDGHPARGGFLPPVPLPRRMWAGGEIRFRAPLFVGDDVVRRSRIEDVQMKEGRSGRLCFVTVRHEVSNGQGVAITERQDIVYRDVEAPSGTAATAPSAAPAGEVHRRFDPTPLALFRYSALTFNGHRIHYDRRYCVEEENYPGLVVHGPLQATLLVHLAADLIGAVPAVFRYRGASPLFDGQAFDLRSREEGGSLRLWTQGAAGRPALEGTAER